MNRDVQAPDALSRTNRVLTTLRAGHRALLRAQDEPTLLRTMCRALVDEGGYLIVWIGYAEDDALRTILPVAHAGREEAFFGTARFSWDAARPSVSGEAIRTGNPSIGRRLSSDPLLAQWRANAARRFASLHTRMSAVGVRAICSIVASCRA